MDKITTKDAAQQEPVAIIQKNKAEQIRIGLGEYREHAYVDLRAFYLDDDSAWVPGRKGFTVPLRLWPEFLAGVQQMTLQLHEQGLAMIERHEAA